MTPVCALTPKASASPSLTSSPKAEIDAGSYDGTEEKCERYKHGHLQTSGDSLSNTALSGFENNKSR